MSNDKLHATFHPNDPHDAYPESTRAHTTQGGNIMQGIINHKRQLVWALIVMLVAAVALAAVQLVVSAKPASANTSALCWVSPDQAARLSVTRYRYNNGWRIHSDLNSSTPLLGVKYYQNDITVNGSRLAGTNDQYTFIPNNNPASVVGGWIMSTGQRVTCKVTSYAG